MFFDNENALDSKINKMTVMMIKLTIQSKTQGRTFKPKIYQGKRRPQGRTNYYDKGRQQGRNRSSSPEGFRGSP